MNYAGTRMGREPHPAGLDLVLFVIEALLAVSSIVLVVHFGGTTAAVFAIGAIVVAGTLAAVRVRGGSAVAANPPSTQRTRGRPRPGDYRATSEDLYRVEEVHRDRVLLEDCRTGVLVDVDLAELDSLRSVPVRSGPGAASTGRSRRNASTR